MAKTKVCSGCVILGKICPRCRYPLPGSKEYIARDGINCCISCDTLGKTCQKCKYPPNDSAQFRNHWTDRIIYHGQLGWVCPLCTIVNSPFVKTCPCTPYQPQGN